VIFTICIAFVTAGALLWWQLTLARDEISQLKSEVARLRGRLKDLRS